MMTAETNKPDKAKQAMIERTRLIALYSELIVCGEHSSRITATKNIRIELKKAFPLTKFSIKSDTFSMGDSIDVTWTDGPTGKQVDAIVDKYNAGSFDGMQDLYTYSSSKFNELFGDAKYVHTHRKCSDEMISAAIAMIARDYNTETPPTVEDFRQGRTWNTYPNKSDAEWGSRAHAWEAKIHTYCRQAAVTAGPMVREHTERFHAVIPGGIYTRMCDRCETRPAIYDPANQWANHCPVCA